jgi:hypothetical protein
VEELMADADLLYLVDIQEPGMISLTDEGVVQWVLVDWDEIKRGDNTEYHRNTIYALFPHRHIEHYPVKRVIRECIARVRELEPPPRWKSQGWVPIHDPQLDWEACSQCASTMIEGGHVSIEGKLAVQVMGCIECGLTWTATYTAQQRSEFHVV